MPGRDIGPRLKELLDKTHAKYPLGLRIENREVQRGDESNGDRSYFECTVKGVRQVEIKNEDGSGPKFVTVEEVFVGHGDCYPTEPGARRGSPVTDTPYRMAESRAQVRAMRLATNTGEAAEEEMPGDGEREEPPQKRQGSARASGGGSQEEDPPMNAGQKKYIENLVGKKYAGDWEAFENDHGSIGGITVSQGKALVGILREMPDAE